MVSMKDSIGDKHLLQEECWPKSLVSAMNNMIDANPYNDRETQMLAEYYAQFADVRLPNSTESINLFDLAGMNGSKLG